MLESKRFIVSEVPMVEVTSLQCYDSHPFADFDDECSLSIGGKTVMDYQRDLFMGKVPVQYTANKKRTKDQFPSFICGVDLTMNGKIWAYGVAFEDTESCFKYVCEKEGVDDFDLYLEDFNTGVYPIK